jgi:transcriptional regulator with GAF, ATPase, and Fis domain
VVARAVHQLSGRPGELVAVNCGALPATLLESELFGSRKGAFSNAVEDRPGLVRAADRGTLFLDEIGDLPQSSQAALLRVLQEREVTPIGGTRPVKIDLRVIHLWTLD